MRSMQQAVSMRFSHRLVDSHDAIGVPKTLTNPKGAGSDYANEFLRFRQS